MSFWSGYWKSLKVRQVEESIDVWVHRPLAYLLARALLPTPVTPNAVTVGSILFGCAAGYCAVSQFAWHQQLAGLAIFLSAVFDCADGQLARMRGTSSLLGRMLDGAADLVVISVTTIGGVWILWHKYPEPAWAHLIVLAATALMLTTGVRHTMLYDHYKNIYLCLTEPGFQDGEDYETAAERQRLGRSTAPLVVRVVWPIYLDYLKVQAKFVRAFDPFTTTRLSSLPKFDATRAAIYRRHAEPLLGFWRGWLGFGSLVFGLALSMGLDLLEVYVALRLVLLNAFYYLYLRPKQRRASARAFDEMGFLPP